MQMRRLLVSGAAVMALATPAGAAPLDITSITGVWVNAVGGLSVAGSGTSAITWGDGAAPESGYTFAAGSDLTSVALATPLLLGTFTHVNQTIPIPNLSGVDLDFGFATNGAPAFAGALFPFAHNETLNTCGGCSPGDDDIVTITTPVVNIPITVGLDTYYFNLLGFSSDGGTTFNSVFTSPEGASNSAGLYGQVTLTRVPEPAINLVLGLGLAMIAGLRRIARR